MTSKHVPAVVPFYLAMSFLKLLPCFELNSTKIEGKNDYFTMCTPWLLGNLCRHLRGFVCLGAFVFLEVGRVQASIFHPEVDGCGGRGLSLQLLCSPALQLLVPLGTPGCVGTCSL